MNNPLQPRDLTIEEKLEMSRLKRHLFTDGSPFLTLNEGIENSFEYKRYNHLVRIQQISLSWRQLNDKWNSPLCFN